MEFINADRGYVFQKPTVPIRVLWLKPSNSHAKSTAKYAPLSVVSIQLDGQATNYERCNCQNPKRNCNISTLECDKGKTELVARILEANDPRHMGSYEVQTTRQKIDDVLGFFANKAKAA